MRAQQWASGRDSGWKQSPGRRSPFISLASRDPPAVSDPLWVPVHVSTGLLTLRLLPPLPTFLLACCALSFSGSPRLQLLLLPAFPSAHPQAEPFPAWQQRVHKRTEHPEPLSLLEKTQRANIYGAFYVPGYVGQFTGLILTSLEGYRPILEMRKPTWKGSKHMNEAQEEILQVTQAEELLLTPGPLTPVHYSAHTVLLNGQTTCGKPCRLLAIPLPAIQQPGSFSRLLKWTLSIGGLRSVKKLIPHYLSAEVQTPCRCLGYLPGA